MHNCRKIFFNDYEVLMKIGINEDEKILSQRVLINLELFLAEPVTAIDDRIENVIDYDSIRKEIDSIVSKGHINLQETLVDEIAELCLAHNEVTAVRVSSEKLDAYANCKSVGFEVLKERNKDG